MGRLSVRSSARRLLAAGLAALVAAYGLAGCASSPERAGKGTRHVVRPGENLYRISKFYGVDTKRLIRANHIRDVTELQVGDRLFVPGARKPQPDFALTPGPARGGGSGGPRAVARRTRPSGDRAQALREAKLDFAWPVQGRLSSHFGWRSGRRHEGIDIPARKGTPVRAAEAGRVIHSGELSAYGYVVIIKHAGRYSTVYAHNRSNKVRKGQFVEKGDVIATVGKSGNATGYHLHFEVRRDRIAQDPVKYLPVVRYAKGGAATLAE
jgi:lipoprotein NlpD